jgi:hypothetical protein
MDHFALLPAAERATVFREASARSRLGSATIIEKDFWVCWTLQRIFSSPTLPGPLFKGGTSLSKVYKIIERFSEDVDIVLDRHALGFTGEQDPPNIAGTNKRNRKLDELASKCSETVQGSILDELQQSFRSILGVTGWKISEDPADADRRSLLFAYPLGLEADLYGVGTYIRPVVRLEFGCRGDVWPSFLEQQSIQPYTADALPGLLARPTTEVHVLRPERTFWEKPQCSMPFTIRARCRPGFLGITMIFRVCTGTNTGSLRSRTSGCWQALSSTRRFSSGKLARGMIWPGPEAFGYLLQTPTSLRFEATTGTCARCSLGKPQRSIR